MSKCIFLLFNRMNECVRKTFLFDDNSYYNHEDETVSLKGSSSFKIIQKSSTNEYVPHGDYTKMENYDIFKKFLNRPLVKIYIEEIFLPNKEIKSFQISKIKGIFNQIKGDIKSLLDRLGMDLYIPDSKYNLSTDFFDLSSNPATSTDLDLYSPLFMLEWWIYPKKFIEKANIKRITFVHDIEFTTNSYTQSRTGCPDYKNTKSLIFATHETNFAYMRIVLHHEFFHYVDYADDQSYDDDGWEKLNQKGFKYGNGGDSEREWVKLEKDIKGFINHYSTTDMAEDRAEIYQYLIGCPDEALNNKDIIVRKKAKRIQNFINTFDKDGIGNIKNNFWANLIDFRKKFPYKEPVFQGHISH